MAEPKKGNPGKEFLEKYGEKLALGISLLILLVFVVFTYGMSSEDPSLGMIEKNRETIRAEENRLHKDAKEMMPPDIDSWGAKAINPWVTVVASARGAVDWSGYLVTKAEGKGRKEEITKKVLVVAPHVSFADMEVAIDSIKVSWLYKDFTNLEVQKMGRAKEKTEAAKASSFTLERQVNNSGKWEVVADKLDSKTLSYVDDKIEPKTKYTYRVTAYSTEKNFLERGGKVDDEVGATPNPDGKINMAMGPTKETMGLWNLSFSNATKPADATKGMVYVKIEKFEKGLGKVEKSHIHYDGDEIGFWEETAGASPTSKHRVSTKGGRAVEVDFNMGATLISVNPVKLDVKFLRCKPIYNPDGTKKECKQITEHRSFDTALITYKDEGVIRKVYVPAPNFPDQLCEEHGGRKIVTQLPEEKDKPEEPKVDPKEVARMKKETDAEKLFDEADRALDKNKSLAIQCYQRLLKDFMDTDFVSKNKKSVIEERLAGLKKK